MLKVNFHQKSLFTFILTILLILSLSGAAIAITPDQNSTNGSDKSPFTLDVHALRDSQNAKLYVTVLSGEPQTDVPNEFKKVQVKVSRPDGQEKSTTNYNDVSAPGGKAIIELGDVPLLDIISVEVLVQTQQTVNTEVLNGTTAVTEFSVNAQKIVVPEFQGYGAQMNMHLYTALNDPTRGFVGNEPPKELENVEAKVKAMKPGLVRIFLSPVNFDPGNENRMDSFIKTVNLAQQAGSTVNVTWWFIERAANDDPVKQKVLMEENMRQFADTLIDLVKNRGLTAVQQITIQNEVNTSWVKPELYEQYYRLLDSYLKDAGIRDHIKFVGGDLVYNNQLTWFTYMADHMGDILDGWSSHIYWNYWDTAYMKQRISDIKGIYTGIAPEKRKPLSITEYGTRGYKFYDNDPKKPIMDINPYRVGALTATLAGKYNDLVTGINETNMAAFEQAWFNMLAVNAGFTGLAKWDAYRAQYDFSYQDYSLIGYLFNPAPGEDRWPLRPSYYMQWLMGNTTGKAWQVLGYEGSSGAKLITPFRSPSGDWTIFALSTDQTATTFSVGDLPANTDFKVMVWNADGSGKVTSSGSVNSGVTGTVNVQAPAGSMVVLTTVNISP
ncbi:hypothetical protein [Paenibacillus sp. Soil724D2]|uniref:hypothetical protein n=1 Tax=Paenibacillus sp. (strain Soil724D2) TaxID=1736392 RepID=UPI000714D6B5|nr:hypothetical protein [Paenibacillus sp. Soil724D2]KRE36490.1 hypothetical protein ASG85_10005 [Paenibacillus sp. Soil724D2]